MTTGIDTSGASGFVSQSDATGTRTRTATTAQERSKGQQFQEVLSNESKESPERPGKFWWPGKLMEDWWTEHASEFRVAEEKSPSAASTNETKRTESEQSAVPESTDDHPGMAKLRELLASEGISEDEVELRYSEEFLVVPMIRSWTNRFITAECANGRLLNFDADLTEKAPWVSMNDIRSMLNGDGQLGVGEIAQG